MGLIDRYILKQFLQTLLFALFALNVIIIVVNLIENLGNLLDNNTPVAVIARFYLYQLPTFISW
jgi:lipopolysaccharide export system permease protein